VVQSCQQPSLLSFDSFGRSLICHLVTLIHKESVNKSVIHLIRVIVRDTGPFHTQSRLTRQRRAVSTFERRQLRTRTDYVRRKLQLVVEELSSGERGPESQ
jgi:hypothetical protein